MSALFTVFYTSASRLHPKKKRSPCLSFRGLGRLGDHMRSCGDDIQRVLLFTWFHATWPPEGVRAHRVERNKEKGSLLFLLTRGLHGRKSAAAVAEPLCLGLLLLKSRQSPASFLFVLEHALVITRGVLAASTSARFRFLSCSLFLLLAKSSTIGWRSCWSFLLSLLLLVFSAWLIELRSNEVPKKVAL
jgi:hypothetical protein